MLKNKQKSISYPKLNIWWKWPMAANSKKQHYIEPTHPSTSRCEQALAHRCEAPYTMQGELNGQERNSLKPESWVRN